MKVFNNYKSNKDKIIKEEKFNNKDTNKHNKKVLILSCGTGGRT